MRIDIFNISYFVKILRKYIKQDMMIMYYLNEIYERYDAIFRKEC